MAIRTSIVWKMEKSDFEKVIKKSKTYTEVCKRFGFKVHGGNFSTIQKRIKEEKIDVSHFILNEYKFNKVLPLNEVLVENSTYSRMNLKRRLLKLGLLEEKCYECGLGKTWNGKPLSLQLEHKNGINNDNRLENLCLLCPNCHSQTDTYAGKKKLKPKPKCIKCLKDISKYTKTGMCYPCYNISSKKIVSHKNVSRKKRTVKPKPKCIKCSTEITTQSKSGLCYPCYSSTQRKVERPNKEDLLKEVLNKPFLQIGKEYGVTDNAIRKWCKYYDLPSTRSEIKKYNEEKLKETLKV